MIATLGMNNSKYTVFVNVDWSVPSDLCGPGVNVIHLNVNG